MNVTLMSLSNLYNAIPSHCSVGSTCHAISNGLKDGGHGDPALQWEKIVFVSKIYTHQNT